MAFLNKKKRVFFFAYSVVEKKGNSIAPKDRFIFIKFSNYYSDRRKFDD